MKRVLWALLLPAGVLVIAGAAGWAWDRSEERSFWALELEPPGAWVEVDGHQLHLVDRGSGSPGIVFISGGGDGYRSFEEVQDSMASESLAVTYDRAGLKWSPPGSRDATVDHHVRDLSGLISDADLFEGPVILVGHSYGGTIARVTAERHPDLVAGVILVDAAEAYAIPEEGRRVLSRMLLRQAAIGTVGLDRWRFYRENEELSGQERLV